MLATIAIAAIVVVAVVALIAMARRRPWNADGSDDDAREQARRQDRLEPRR